MGKTDGGTPIGSREVKLDDWPVQPIKIESGFLSTDDPSSVKRKRETLSLPVVQPSHARGFGRYRSKRSDEVPSVN